MENIYREVISPVFSTAFVPHMNLFESLLERRELLWQFLVRNIKSRHKGSVLGALWIIINPLLMLGLYVFAFGVVFGGRFSESAQETTLDYALGVFLGLATLNIINGVIGSAPTVINSQPNFVKKVVFPLEILPTAMVGAFTYDLIVSFSLCTFGIVLLGPGITASFLWLPVIILPVFLIALGLAWLLSALGVFIRDISQIGSFLGLVLLYSSGVFYSAQKAKETAPVIWQFLQWNPILHIVDNLRQVLLWRGEPNWSFIVYSYAFGGGTLWVGAWIFKRLRPAFADVV
jgi:lipopolysaccharide transport system permease protein